MSDLSTNVPYGEDGMVGVGGIHPVVQTPGGKR